MARIKFQNIRVRAMVILRYLIVDCPKSVDPQTT